MVLVGLTSIYLQNNFLNTSTEALEYKVFKSHILNWVGDLSQNCKQHILAHENYSVAILERSTLKQIDA